MREGSGIGQVVIATCWIVGRVGRIAKEGGREGVCGIVFVGVGHVVGGDVGWWGVGDRGNGRRRRR